MKTNITNIILTFSVLVSIQSFSQNYSRKFDSIIKFEIENKNVTKIGYTELSCIGYSVYLEAYLCSLPIFVAFPKTEFIKKMESENKFEEIKTE